MQTNTYKSKIVEIMNLIEFKNYSSNDALSHAMLVFGFKINKALKLVNLAKSYVQPRHE